ncbi:hypothetical protein LTR37_015261 [Vermiconidia calcicola]|uniref:Uncharacterized protein n=1 Tax=Vermiconidia calcicola TaxID=1690605 RepID=A0ACC3MR76_9PEZI|nr:hypothetical protein LTR37_015261 [Vermiconidia calcicola]
MEPTIHTVFESVTCIWQYIAADPATREAVIIDSVLDYNKETGAIGTVSADKLMQLVDNNDYTITRILETHAHADHLTASIWLQHELSRQQKQQPLVCIGRRITQVQKTIGLIYRIPEREMQGAFDHMLSDGERFHVGNIEAKVVYLPGHTPDHVGYIVRSNIFTGDSMFHPDLGTARCDFPGGSATELYNSMRKLLGFPGNFKLYTGHDYPPKDRRIPAGETPGPIPYTTVESQSRKNKHVKVGTQMDQFVKMRTKRDASLSEPTLLRQSMHVNLRGGRLPADAVEGFKISQRPSSIPTVASGCS